MTQFKWTPGEWKLYTHDTGESWIYSENNEQIEGDVVCEAPNHYEGESLEYWPANAALICAAPDLLEALQRLVNAVRYESVRSPEEWEAIEKAKKAIGKALKIQP